MDIFNTIISLKSRDWNNSLFLILLAVDHSLHKENFFNSHSKATTTIFWENNYLLWVELSLIFFWINVQSTRDLLDIEKIEMDDGVAVYRWGEIKNYHVKVFTLDCWTDLIEKEFVFTDFSFVTVLFGSIFNLVCWLDNWKKVVGKLFLLGCCEKTMSSSWYWEDLLKWFIDENLDFWLWIVIFDTNSTRIWFKLQI